MRYHLFLNISALISNNHSIIWNRLSDIFEDLRLLLTFHCTCFLQLYKYCSKLFGNYPYHSVPRKYVQMFVSLQQHLPFSLYNFYQSIDLIHNSVNTLLRYTFANWGLIFRALLKSIIARWYSCSNLLLYWAIW